jgi:hypothetical protein
MASVRQQQAYLVRTYGASHAAVLFERHFRSRAVVAASLGTAGTVAVRAPFVDVQVGGVGVTRGELRREERREVRDVNRAALAAKRAIRAAQR